MDLESVASTDLSDWDVVKCFLPDGWQDQARRLGALRRAKGFVDSEQLLRTLLIHLVEGCSLKETALRARRGDLAQVSPVAIWKRLRGSGEWFRWMAEALMKRWVSRLPGDVLAGPYRLRLVDGSVVTEPGSTGSDWKLHYAVELGTLRCDFLEVTDTGGGETLRRVPVSAGDLVIADRAYCNRGGIRHVVGKEGEVLVRLHLTNLPLQTTAGKPFALMRRLGSLRMGQVGDWPCRLAPREDDEAEVMLRLCAIKKTRTAAEQARKKMRRKASQEGRSLRPDTLAAAGYIFVVTTVPRTVLAAQPLLELYRGRWQVELAFKRLKSILGFGHLPKKDPEGARAWLHDKLLVAFLVEALIQAGESFFPWGYPVGPPGTERQ